MPLHPRRFHRVLGQCFVDALALGAFESPQIGTVRTRLDPRQQHAASTPRAAWPFDRKQRWTGVAIGLGHVEESPCRTALPVTVQYCSHSRRINDRLGKPGLSRAQPCSRNLSRNSGEPGCEMTSCRDFGLSNIAQQNIKIRINIRVRGATF
jgi:hypothetical protein